MMVARVKAAKNTFLMIFSLPDSGESLVLSMKARPQFGTTNMKHLA